MAGDIAKLLELLVPDRSLDDLSDKLESDSAASSLRSFYTILKFANERTDDERLKFQTWSKSQLESVVTIAKLLVCAARSLTVERGHSFLHAVIEETLKFAVCYLEASVSDRAELSLQDDVLQLLELALVDGVIAKFNVSHLSDVYALVEALPVVSVQEGCTEYHMRCSVQGINHLADRFPADRLIIKLTSENLQVGPQATWLTEVAIRRDLNAMASFILHLAVSHVRCVPRLLFICVQVLEAWRDDTRFFLRISLNLRVVKLLKNIVKDISYVAYDAALLNAVSCYADVMPAVFKTIPAVSRDNIAPSNDFGLDHLLLSLLEEFLQFMQLVFGDTSIFHNVQTCILASLLGALDASIWRYDKCADASGAPLVYSPRIVWYILKLLGTVTNWPSQAHFRRKPDFDASDTSGPGASCHAFIEKMPVLKKYTCEERVKLVFSPSVQWVDNLVHVAYFLHLDGIKSNVKNDTAGLSCMKVGSVLDKERGINHEDEAIFGDLFSETSRLGSLGDGSEIGSTLSNSVSTCFNMPTQVARDILNFLKLHAFSPEWYPTVYADGCKKLTENHIDMLLSILFCRACSFDEPLVRGNLTVSSQMTVDACYEFLQSLLVHRVLSDHVEEYFVDEILKENFLAFTYNDYVIMLLAHALVCKVGPDISHMTRKIYQSYTDFILNKSKGLFLVCPSTMSEFVDSLPSILHIEILLVAFNLSSKTEKIALAELIFSSLKVLDVPPDGYSVLQLSCWSLLISRLILVLRYMLLYSSDCPSWLVTSLKTILKGKARYSLVHGINSPPPSWAYITVKSLMGQSIKELTSSSNLLYQLIDVVYPASGSMNVQAYHCLGLHWSDLCTYFSLILKLWTGKEAEAVEDLVIERYIFKLCWDTLSIGTAVCLERDLEYFDITNIRAFFEFRHTIISRKEDISDRVVSVLEQLNSVNIPSPCQNKRWDLLRNGSWLSLVISLLQAGIWSFAVSNDIPGIEHFFTQTSCTEVQSLGGGVVSTLFQSNRVVWLFTILSSLLRKQLQFVQEAFIASLQRKSDMGRFSPLLLLKHTAFQISLKKELFERRGSNLSVLDCIYSLLPKLDEVIGGQNFGSVDDFFICSLVHGFPCYVGTYSSFLLSSILNVRGIIYTLDGLLKVSDARCDLLVERDLILDLFDSVVRIKFDVIFQQLQSKCSYICSCLSKKINLDLSYLFVLKHVENFLTDVCSTDDIDSDTYDIVISSAVAFMEEARHNSSTAEDFRFYVGIEKKLCIADRELYDRCHGNPLALLDAMSSCQTESVNVKVLKFFVDILSLEPHSSLKVQMQEKFLAMDMGYLSEWLEQRLLGCKGGTLEMSAPIKGSSACLRESTVNFISCLVFPTSEPLSKELKSRLVEALLISADGAFISYDIHTAKAYFNSVIQLSNNEPSMAQLLKVTVALMEKLVGLGNKFEELKFMFGFVMAILAAGGADKNISDKLLRTCQSRDSLVVGASVSRSLGSKKNLEPVVISACQETHSTSVDCDTASVDDDEDDATSDGELASIDKDEEEDNNSERALASRLCTFTSSGSNFMEQHWYFCYTCDLTVSKGCCSVCAKVCHRGHRVVYSRSSRFFCDCGAGGVRGSSCLCLKPRKFVGGNTVLVHEANKLCTFLPSSGVDGVQTPDFDSDREDDICADTESFHKLIIPREMQEALPSLLQELDIEARIIELCGKVMPMVIRRRECRSSREEKISLAGDKIISFSADLLQLKKTYKSGSIDLKVKVDYSNGRELKSHLTSGSLVKSLLAVSSRGRLAVGEGDKVTIFDAGQLIGQPTVAPVTADKSNLKSLSKNVVRFEIVHLLFNPIMESYLLVAGFEECQILTVNSRGEVTDRLAVELALQGAHVRSVSWLPSSQVQLMVVTNLFVKIYDLSQDNISPLHYFTLPEDSVVDATLITSSQGRLFLLVLSEQGCLYRLELSAGGEVGARPLTEVISVQGKHRHSNGLSLYYSSTYRVLFVSYQDGTTLIGCLNHAALSLTENFIVFENESGGKLRPAGLHHWKELITGSQVFTCLSTLKSNAPLAVLFGPNELLAQNIRSSAGSGPSLVGITSYRPLSKDRTQCFVLYDDGSLQILSQIPFGAEKGACSTSDQAKKLDSGILDSGVYAGANLDFPLEFFEKTICITGDVKFSCDAIKNCDSEGIKQSLSSDDGFLESISLAGFKITVSNTNPDIVMVGIRLHVGNTSANHIPSNISIFRRVVKLDEGIRSWYDLPFTVAESLLADEEFVVTVGPTFNGSVEPRIDSLEVYGRAKDEFGWKEKMDVLLDMETHLIECSSGIAEAQKVCLTRTASIQEEVMADGLRLLSRFYSFCKCHVCTDTDSIEAVLCNLKCRNLLETVFESDREHLLQSAACSVIRAIFPRREMYYQMRDTLRLLGAVKSSSFLASCVRVGGASAEWVIKEFTTHVHAVSKIAQHRRSNMASFLETHGTHIVDGLMQVLWDILDLEQLECQAINNIIIPSVELIYNYAECLALHGSDNIGYSVRPAVLLLKRLLFSPYTAVQTSSSLAISSRLLQVPFPKQMILATDDSGEVAASASMTSGSTGAAGRNAHVPIEDESVMSSVQYCCDGCSTVPIQKRRWHCNICPDFDLCEVCYDAMDTDRLPPPHSRDHPMSAIPIETEPTGDSHEINFSVEGNGPNVSQAVSEANMDSSPSVNLLEHNVVSGEFSPAVDQTVVSISATKRLVNSLLLSELLAELKGWMEMISGVRALPVMQLFYRLSSAVGGPFMDSSKPENLDLEMFAKWFLDEINLRKPFMAKIRSPFGEVIILVFMFFTLMLRNWHQPGIDNSMLKSTDNPERGVFQSSPLNSSQPSLDDKDRTEFRSHLLRACSVLKQQTFLDYLMNILQQLVHTFKSSSMNLETGQGVPSGAGCGVLLSVRRELPAGNFSPFFSDSYAKAHRVDLFIDYHRLLLENTFRLVYSLIRPDKQDKHMDKDKQDKYAHRSFSGRDLKLDGYHDVLCNYINNPYTTSVRRYARRLFLYLCGSKTQYYSIRDFWQLTNEVKKLYRLAEKSDRFQNPLPYEKCVKLLKFLSSICDIAGARPRNWQKYCSKHTDVLNFLKNGIFYFGEESVLQALKLLNLAFYTGKDMGHTAQRAESGDVGIDSNKVGSQLDQIKKTNDDVNEHGSEKAYLDMEQAVGIFNDANIRTFIDSFLLEWNSSAVRSEAKCVIYGVWHHGKQAFREAMLRILLEKVKELPMYGQNIVEYIQLLILLVGNASDASEQQDMELVTNCLTPAVIRSVFDTLHYDNELLANHPNARIYNTLSGLVEFDGYYLESEPCVSCSCPEVPYTKMKLETLKSETKFTDNRIIFKCSGSYMIQCVSMNVHDARKSKSVKVLNLYYNNKTASDLSELKNNWGLWKRAKSCHLSVNQTELKVDFSIPITACNFMIELDSFYENLQASSLELLQCPRCSRSVTDKHGICSNCHENAYQCRQCRNINYENLDSFLCNECGYSKYGRFEFNFMARPSFLFDDMDNDEDMKKGLAAIESESENAHRRYQQLMGFKKPLLKLVSSMGENEIESHQKDSVQQMMFSLSGPSCKVNRRVALLGVLYGEKCKAAFDSVSKSVQTLQGLRRVLMKYLHRKHADNGVSPTYRVPRSPNNCYGCATTFVTQCLELLLVLSRHLHFKRQLISMGILSELFENNIHHGPRATRVQARAVLCAFSAGDVTAVTELNNLIHKKVMYCLSHHRSVDIAAATSEELLLLSETCSLSDDYWEARLRVVFQLLFSSIRAGSRHPAISEHVILPCLRIVSHACTLPKPDRADKEERAVKFSSVLPAKDDNSENVLVPSDGLLCGNKSLSDLSEKHRDSSEKSRDVQLLSYSEWEKGASYIDFVRRQYKVSQAVDDGLVIESQQGHHRSDYLALKYALRWKRYACRRTTKSDFSALAMGSWVSELILSACSQTIRSETCLLVTLLCEQSLSRRFQLVDLLIGLLPMTLSTGESAAEYFDLIFKLTELEDARLFLTARNFLTTICQLMIREVGNIELQEQSLHVDISQGFILHKLVELLSKFLEVQNIRSRFIQCGLLSDVLEALLVVRGLVVQKTKLIGDCSRLLKGLLDGLLLESKENKKHFIRACISGLQNHGQLRGGRTSPFVLEQLCNTICPSKPESVYLLILNKAHTQDEFIRGSMTKNPYSSTEIGPLMRDVKNKICHQLDLLGLLEDDYGMELLVAGNIISLDLSISQVYEQVWKKSQNQMPNSMGPSGGLTSGRDSPPMTVTYRLQGLDGEATEPMIKELEDEREESQDPEIEFSIAGAVRECGGLEIILSIIEQLWDDDLKSNKEELASLLNLLLHCCKIRENRRALLRAGALGLLLETARRAFSVDAMEPAEGILLIVESLTMEANESDIGINQSVLAVADEKNGAGEQAKKIILMFLERLSHPSGLRTSYKRQRNTEMVARILPYLTYGQPAAMEALIHHFEPYLQDWDGFDRMYMQHEENPEDEVLAQQALKHMMALENFVRVSESLKTSSCGERLKDIILDMGITKAAVKHLQDSFTCTRQDGFKMTADWSLGLRRPSVPLILSMLKGLSKGHLPTQRVIDEEGILTLLHILEGVTGESEIGARAENLLDTLSDKEGKGGAYLGLKVHMLRHATRDEMRRRALRKREELLQGLGMRQEVSSDGGERIVVSKPVIEGLEDVQEEEGGLACMVCREGYSLRPTDVLGIYAYSKRVNLGAGPTSTRGEFVYTTVSHFNIIHFQCHQEAKRADAALKNPKKEWEGAALRNNETLCNCLFPLKGNSVPLAQYTRCVDQYWDNLNALGRADGSRLQLITYDIVLMLARFATGASFSTDCKGGGRESNSRFLPFMVQMACHLLEQGGAGQRKVMAKSVSAYLSSTCPEARILGASGGRSSGIEETIQFMMVTSLLSESYEDWSQHRRAFLQQGIHHAYWQQSHTRTTSLRLSDPTVVIHLESLIAESSSRNFFSVVFPMLVYIGLIEQLQKFFKVTFAETGDTSNIAVEVGNGALEHWEIVMKERLENMKEMVALSKELLLWLEDMNSSSNLQEAFDIMGVLGDALSGSFLNCDDFVQVAIGAGKC